MSFADLLKTGVSKLTSYANYAKQSIPQTTSTPTLQIGPAPSTGFGSTANTSYQPSFKPQTIPQVTNQQQPTTFLSPTGTPGHIAPPMVPISSSAGTGAGAPQPTQPILHQQPMTTLNPSQPTGADMSKPSYSFDQISQQTGQNGSDFNRLESPRTEPNAMQPPGLSPEVQRAIELSEQAYQQSLKLSPDELSTQADIDKVMEEIAKANLAFQKGYVDTAGQPISMQFITGQQAQLQRQNAITTQALANQAEPLENKLARLQAARQSSLEASKFALERADATAERELLSKERSQELNINEQRYQDELSRIDRDFAENQRRFGLEYAMDERQLSQSILESNRAFSENVRQFGLEYAIKEQDSAMRQIEFQQAALEKAQEGKLTEAGAIKLQGKMSKIEDLINHDGLDAAVGAFRSNINPFQMHSKETFIAGVENLISEETLQSLIALKAEGGTLGALSDAELQILQEVATYISSPSIRKTNERGEVTGYAMPEKEMKDALLQIRERTANILALAGYGDEIYPEHFPTGSEFPMGDKYYRKTGEDSYEEIPFRNDLSTSLNGSGMQSLAQSIIQQESGGNYNAVGEVPAGHSEIDKALGKYQIVPKYHFDKIGLNYQSATDRQKFLNSPQLQDQLFNKIIAGLAQTYNNDPYKIAAAYYGGSSGANKVGTAAGDQPQYAGGREYPSINQYTQSVVSRIT